MTSLLVVTVSGVACTLEEKMVARSAHLLHQHVQHWLQATGGERGEQEKQSGRVEVSCQQLSLCVYVCLTLHVLSFSLSSHCSPQALAVSLQVTVA